MKLPAGHVAGVGVHKATAYGGFGQQMLEKMGWSKGQGLGKQKHGMKEAIEVKKKEDALGVSEQSVADKLKPFDTRHHLQHQLLLLLLLGWLGGNACVAAF
jgi:hypothetical protein